MVEGWIRAYKEEQRDERGRWRRREDKAKFRKEFKTELKAEPDGQSRAIRTLRWGDKVELPSGLSNDSWTEVKVGRSHGHILSSHLVEIRYVAKSREHTATLTTTQGRKRKLLWGDIVQVIKPGVRRAEVRARGSFGKMDVNDLTQTALLELYFIDVGQGDGVLMRTPDGRHMLIDGGLERSKQLTGKNAADFTDWKFFVDYGDFEIKLDSMMASHSDNDHYGGLHDLVRDTTTAERELDCLKVSIKTFHHPGLSRWSKNPNTEIPHRQGLGPCHKGFFIRLLDDRADAEASLAGAEKLSGPWKRFIKDVLGNSRSTKVKRVTLASEELKKTGGLPLLWPSKAGCDVRVLAPVTKIVDGRPALKDFKKKSFNTNGHSICLRVDYGNARILLTGDLNTVSMDWLYKCYGPDKMGAWKCDVAKACHHGSADISYRFLEAIEAGATVISSGDAEGHAHPMPGVVGASACAGHVSVDRKNDKLITPLIYMTEVERSMGLGALNRIDIRNYPSPNGPVNVSLPCRNLDEFNSTAYLTPEAREQHRGLGSEAARDFANDFRDEQIPVLEPLVEGLRHDQISIDFNLTVPGGPLATENKGRSAWNSRVVAKSHYGLVNVRTDGDTIMCATLNETEKKWVIHTFPARF